MSGELPKFNEWSVAAVWLLRGVVYADDDKPWNLILSNPELLAEYFARLGLRVVVDETEGLAYLRQLRDDEQPRGYDALPRLFRTTRLSYGQTLMCVLLRDEYRRFEERDIDNERCVVASVSLFDQWRAFFPEGDDDVKKRREMLTALRRLEDLQFVRRFGDDSWEIRRILKARLPTSELETLRDSLMAANDRSRQ